MATIDSATWLDLGHGLRLKTGKFKDDGGTEAKLVGTCGPIGSQDWKPGLGAREQVGEMGDTTHLWGRCAMFWMLGFLPRSMVSMLMKFDCGALRFRQYTFVPRTQVGLMMKLSLN
jgi:hypothetical protein